MQEMLFLCHRIPYPPDKGEKIRAYHFLQHLTRSFTIHLGCLADNPADLAHVSTLRRSLGLASIACFPLDRRRAKVRSLEALWRGAPLSARYFHDSRLAHWVREILAQRSLAQVFVFSSSMAPYVLHERGLPRVLDMVDVDSEKFRAYAAETHPPLRLIWEREARTLLHLERTAAQRFDRTLLASPAEEARFLERAPECLGHTGWVRNGVDATYFSPLRRFCSPFAPEHPAIVFTGTMNYRPNDDAVTWFSEAVMPTLSQRTPAPVFAVVGSDPVRAVRHLAQRPNILVTGRVADTRPFLAHAAVVVAPLRIGRGIQNKVLEAMAMGRPVVASAAAAEGITATPGRDLLVADTPEAVARSISEILDGRHSGLGAAAREAVLRCHSWEAAFARLDTFLSGLRPAVPRSVDALP